MDKTKRMEIDLQREISFIVNTKVKDPKIGFVTITGVELSHDYSWLNVFVSIMGEKKKIHDSMKGLDQCKGFIKKNLNERIKLRSMPKINFVYDNSVDRGIRITTWINYLIDCQTSFLKVMIFY